MIPWLEERTEAGLFCSPGLGKTPSTLKAWDTRALAGKSKGLLIVAPLRVCNITWPDQVHKWDFTQWMTVANMRTEEGLRHWENQTADIYLVNPEMLPSQTRMVACKVCKGRRALRDKCKHCDKNGYQKKHYKGWVEKYLYRKNKKDLPVDDICYDEISLAKNPDSIRFNSIRAFRDMFNCFWGLTGTPAPNSYLDLWAQIRLLDDGARLSPSKTAYEKAFFEQTGGDGRGLELRADSKERIHELLSDLAITLRSEDYLDVPTPNYVDEPVSLTKKAWSAYNQLKKELLLEIENAGGLSKVEALNAAALTGKLLQMTGGEVYDSEEEKKSHHIHDCKLLALKKIRSRHPCEPLLVLCAYKHEYQRVIDAFPGAEMFDEKNMDRWKAGKIPMWVANPRSMSHGIDGMQEGGRIAIWFTLTYSNEAYIQTNARLVRTGQSEESIVYRLIAGGTVDDAVAEAVRDKETSQKGLFAALKNLQTMERIAA